MTTNTQEIELLEIFEKSTQTLSTYLEDDNIKNILLSGRFGIGKTTFLEEYFKNNTENYELVKISPVNYSILSNQDIFRYIKFDILYLLLEKVDFDIEAENADLITWMEGLPIYIRMNIISLLSGLVFLIPKVGKPIEKILKLITTHHEKFQAILAKANEDKDLKLIQTLYSQMAEEEGGLYENNETTKIINRLLSFYESKKRVLVIDDLDRVDPQHIFRILNILSAQSDANKFDFDKIMLVGDVKNIRSIFSAQYGQKADFSGYIDKFYDRDIFYFDNRESIASNIEQIVKSMNIKVNQIEFDVLLGHRAKKYLQNLVTILTDAVSKDKMNLRSLLKYWKKDLILPMRKISYSDQISYYDSVSNHQISLILLFDILYKLIGQDLKELLIFLSTQKSNFTYSSNLVGDTVLILDMENFHPSKTDKDLLYTQLDVDIKYKQHEGYKYNERYTSTVGLGSTEKSTYYFLHKAHQKLEELNYF